MVEGSGPLALEIDSVSHAFGARKALDNVSCAIAPSEYRVLLGLNGAGKTTLFSLITRLYDNASGGIRVFGHDVRRQPQRALRQLGVVFQQRTLDLDLSIMQNLIYHGALHGIPPARAKRRAEEELERLGLAVRAGDKVRKLSGGQMRRVEIARALLHRPRLLLLDEPTVGLDIDSRQSIVDHVQRLCRDERLAVLWATHLIDEVLPRSQVIVLHRGRVLADGPLDRVVAEAGARDIRETFLLLTRDGDGGGDTVDGDQAA
ncbi:MAG: ATP-binding cassette domain-containing protein [Kiloniellaceae bacterium]